MSRHDPIDTSPSLELVYRAPGPVTDDARLTFGQQRQVPEPAAVAAEEALREGVWKIADEVARADWEPGDFGISAAARAEAVDRINRLMDAAATLARLSTRDNWAQKMIDARALAQES
ncbi:hypothetical protein RM190_20190 [Paracoccus sp. CPCC 101403]|uniref:Uncharacterized protein n=1 Tax=Paracoccus broussonetiae TaxID=3075834 RepID=A0ABU3EIZ1_9RHOB|nr:hypothetical protein [Paracoccus sp. CPCC 101403]MDT1064194.1 hypothetical protein [Paracoccus sp. CPCC 101403]